MFINEKQIRKIAFGDAVVSGETERDRILPYEELIPEDHRYLFAFLEKDLGRILASLHRAVQEEDSTLLALCREDVRSLHPYFTHGRALDVCVDATTEAIRSGEDIRAGSMMAKHSLFSLIDLQDRMRKMVVFLLDDSNEEMAALSPDVRIGFYLLARDTASGGDALSAPKARYMMQYPPSMDVVRAATDISDEYLQSLKEALSQITDSGGRAFPDVLKKIACTAKADAKHGGSILCLIGNLPELLETELFAMLRDGVRLKRCAECGRYFPVTKDNDRFCAILGKDGRSCLSRHIRKKKSEALHKIYTQSYRSHFARVKAGKETKDKLDAWRIDSQRLQDKVYADEMTLQEYKETLMRKL